MLSTTVKASTGPWQRMVPALGATLRQLAEYEKLLTRDPYPLSAARHLLLRGVLAMSQRRLQKHAHNWQHREMTLSYLLGRRSLCFHSNVSYLFENDPNLNDGCSRGAQLIHRALAFRQLIRHGMLPIEHEKSATLDQSFYHFLFGCTRVPGVVQDSIQVTNDSQHIVVACRGQLFMVSGLTGVPSQDALYAALKALTTLAHTRSTGQGPGLWTTLPRTEWAEIRIKLFQDTTQAKYIETIEKAILWVALDLDQSPSCAEESIRLLSVDNYKNRWFDRSQQLIVFGNGVAGLNRDHTLLDGHLALLYAEYLTGHRTFPPDLGSQTTNPVSSEINFSPLDCPLDPSMSEKYRNAADLWDQTRKSFAIHQWDDAAVNAVHCRRHRVSADFAVQAAIHLACYLFFGTWQSISESVHMRHTLGGRYDSILTLTPTLKNLILTMIAVKNQSLDKQAMEDIAQKFCEAQNAHRELIRRCKEGLSPVLHMAALLQNMRNSALFKLSREGLQMPGGFFWRPQGILKAMYCDVTTSHPGYRPGVAMVSFTDTEPHIIGIAYLVKSDCTKFFLKGDHKKQAAAPKLMEHLKQSLDLMGRIISTISV